MKGELRKLAAFTKTILVVDYTGCNESEMMDLATRVKSLLLTENRPQVLLAVFSDKNYATPIYMRHLEKETEAVIHLMEKMAVIGLSATKLLQLKGYNFTFKRNFKAFASKEEAIAYLTDDTTTDGDLPPYFKDINWP